jgi:RimJ/RimL family protein N-acetyltransferase
VKLVPVSEVSTAPAILYRLLAERTKEQAISHKEMPSYGDHLNFVRGSTYLAWYLIQAKDGAYVGSIYLTRRREVGVAIFREYHRSRYGTDAVRELMRLHPGSVLANINPENLRSMAFFKELGFRPHQVTYRFFEEVFHGNSIGEDSET